MKKLQKTYTTTEQSQQLLNLGVPADSADMCYTINDDTKAYNVIPTCIPYEQFTAKRFYMPCWTVGRLMEIFESCVKYGSLDWVTIKRANEELKLAYIDYLVFLLDRHVRLYEDLDFSKLDENRDEEGIQK